MYDGKTEKQHDAIGWSEKEDENIFDVVIRKIKEKKCCKRFK